MQTNRSYLLKRALKTLLRDPIAFWRDSAFKRLCAKLLGTIRRGAERPSTARMKTATKRRQSQAGKGGAQVLLQFPARAMPAGPNRKSMMPGTPVLEGAMLGTLSRDGVIRLEEATGSLQGWGTALVHTEQGTDDALALRAVLSDYVDFSPFKDAALNHIVSEIAPDEAVISILNRIDAKNKERIAHIDNLVLLNVSGNVAQALRCCGPMQRTVLVLTDHATDDLAAMPSDVDAVICLASHPAAQLKWPRMNVIAHLEALPQMLRKVLQDIGPKRPGMLLPLIGGLRHDRAVADFDARRYQGIIRLTPGPVQGVASMHEYVTMMAGRVNEMLVLDSVYLRYRSQCEAIEQGASPASLIEACLQDGVLFDVH